MIFLASTQKLYEKIAQGECGGFTVPAFNIRTLTFDIARALFRAAKKERVGAFIMELAQSEMNYTAQSPKEYVKQVTKAAKKENFKGPLFIQGDHFKCNEVRPRYIRGVEELIGRAIGAGFYNIDIDCSKLSIKENSKLTAHFTNFIRKLQPKNLTISIGGEVGEIGGKNTTVKELREFMEGYTERLSQYGNLKGIIKVAVQTGTSHGGFVLPSGELKQVEADLQTLTELSREAKKYGMAGGVQHGASTLPEKYFSRFPKTGACEIHLATIFQNIIYDSPYFPEKLKDKIYNWLKKKFQKQKKETDTDIQFLYKFRKRALGPFKKEIWDIPQKNRDEISEQLEKEFVFLFKVLKVSNTKNLIKKFYSKNSFSNLSAS